MCLSSTILLFYNLVKLSKSGDGLKGAIINLASNLLRKSHCQEKMHGCMQVHISNNYWEKG